VLQAGDYGKQRVWASIGWGAASLPAGWLISQAGIASGFMVYGLASIPLVYVGTQLRYNYASAAAAAAVPAKQQQHGSAGKVQAAAGQQQQQQQAGVGMRQLLQQPVVLSFLWKCLLMGFGIGVMGTYEFLWLKQLGAPETLMGMALLVSHLVSLFVCLLSEEVDRHQHACSGMQPSWHADVQLHAEACCGWCVYSEAMRKAAEVQPKHAWSGVAACVMYKAHVTRHDFCAARHMAARHMVHASLPHMSASHLPYPCG
jgi:hypothetical protein